ncbi:MAG: hypothetical protein E7677_04525 [Ruminococcaceae bacterium]|nr:hypothetical protein [Oscillospiraceae bacterium]
MHDKHTKKGAIAISRAFSILLPLCLFSILLAGIIISLANDVYAFVKPNTDISVTVSSPISDTELSKLLQKNGVIKNPTVFKLYLRSKGLSPRASEIMGEWVLNSNMSYREIVSEIF